MVTTEHRRVVGEAGVRMNGTLFQALQLGDSFFPIGVFSFSQALESFVQDQLVDDVASLSEYLESLLEQVAWTDGIALLHACDAAARGDVAGLIAVDQEIRAFKLGQESRTMTARTGRQLLRVGVALWPAALVQAERLTRDRLLVPTYPVALGCVAAAAGLEAADAFALELYSTAACICGAALRLLRVDHIQMQKLLLQANSWSRDLYTACHDRDLADMRTSAPALDVEGMRHEQAFVRLFAN